MYKILLSISVFFLTLNNFAQELNCTVVVSAGQIVAADPQLFKTLETTISEFMNQTKWTNKTYDANEKIDCSILFNLSQKIGNNSFTGSIQVQSSRPVFNSSYASPVLNYKDEDLSFSYTEFEPLRYDVNSYQSELVSTLSFFANLIIAMDADTFELNGGDEQFFTCQKIVDQVEDPNNKKAWKSNTNKFNRYQFLNKIMSPTFKNYRTLIYNYHRLGLDTMTENQGRAKETIQLSLIDMSGLSTISMGAQLVRTFMDAKADEIVDIFTGGPMTDNTNLINSLNRMAPTQANKWEKIQ